MAIKQLALLLSGDGLKYIVQVVGDDGHRFLFRVGGLNTLEQAVALSASEHGQQGINDSIDQTIRNDGDQGGDRQIDDVLGIKRMLASA